MIEQILSLGAWNWFILGVLLLAVELMVPGTFMLWLGIAAIMVGLVSFLIDWSWQAQVATFSVLAVVSVVVWWRVGRGPKEITSDQPFLNRRSQGYVGRLFTLDKPIVGGIGTVKIDDSLWRVTGPDTPAGRCVKVVRADGPTLIVERVEA
jgi:membrane protein implicated in regulation of membrane protease activity